VEPDELGGWSRSDLETGSSGASLRCAREPPLDNGQGGLVRFESKQDGTGD
jgi:hypothetical protein